MKHSQGKRSGKELSRLKRLYSGLLGGRHKAISQELLHDSYFWKNRTDLNTVLKISSAYNYCTWSHCWGTYFFNDRLWDYPVYLRTILYNLTLKKAGPLPLSVIEDPHELGFHGCWLVRFEGNHFISLIMVTPPSPFLAILSSVNSLCPELFYWWLNSMKT